MVSRPVESSLFRNVFLAPPLLLIFRNIHPVNLLQIPSKETHFPPPVTFGGWAETRVDDLHFFGLVLRALPFIHTRPLSTAPQIENHLTKIDFLFLEDPNSIILWMF
jgi:hypothetical protein